jgi:intracellular septation protein
MVSAVPAGKIRPAGRRTASILNSHVRSNNPPESTTMKDILTRLGSDFFSTIVFFTLYFMTGNVLLATAVAIAGAVGQVIYVRIRGQQLTFMAYASLTLVILLGTVTLLTNDPRFVMAKPAIGHFAIGAIMLKRGWLLRYMPPIVTETIPEFVTMAGYAWAALMFVLGLGTIAVASTGDLKLWAIYVSVVLIGAKLIAFAVQYVAFRFLVTSRIRAAGGRRPQAPAGPLGIGGEMGYTAPEA